MGCGGSKAEAPALPDANFPKPVMQTGDDREASRRVGAGRLAQGSVPGLGLADQSTLSSVPEADDQMVLLRETLKASQLRWARVLKREFRTLFPEADDAALELKTFQFKGLVLAYGHSRRLLDDETARGQALAAYRGLVAA